MTSFSFSSCFLKAFVSSWLFPHGFDVSLELRDVESRMDVHYAELVNLVVDLWRDGLIIDVFDLLF